MGVAVARSRVQGRAVLAVTTAGGTTRLDDLRQEAPLRVLFPHVPAGEPMTAALTNTAGGLVGGDALSVTVTAAEDSRLLAMAQAAEKVYRSTGADCRVEVRLAAAAGAWLEWLPQETILFEAARLRRRTVLDLHPASSVLAGEMLVFGRAAHGEVLRSGLARDAWEVRIGGRLVWADALHLEGDLARLLAHPATFDGARLTATLLHHGRDTAALRDVLRERPAPEGVLRGATVVNGLLVIRWLAADALAARTDFAACWAALRQAAAGLPARLPRLWHI
jgi:urease accessory protein